MRLLLDTHTFLWLVFQKHKLSSRAAMLCTDPSNTLLVSVVSLWEIVIKQQAGKLELQSPLAEVVEEQQRENRVQLLSVSLPHILQIEALPISHKDPFDRLLIAQAIVEEADFLTQDSLITAYPVKVIW